MIHQRLIHDLIGLQPGYIQLFTIDISDWGQQVVVTGLYRHPPQEQPFRLIFRGCRNINWYAVEADAEKSAEDVQLMTHDLGEPDYRRTARLATTRAEIVISYRQLAVETPDTL